MEWNCATELKMDFVDFGDLGWMPSEQVGEDQHEQCVEDALEDAEDCLLSGGSDCKAKGEKALEACKKLQ